MKLNYSQVFLPRGESVWRISSVRNTKLLGSVFTDFPSHERRAGSSSSLLIKVMCRLHIFCSVVQKTHPETFDLLQWLEGDAAPPAATTLPLLTDRLWTQTADAVPKVCFWGIDPMGE